MPSDERVQLALRTLAGRRGVYRAATGATLARARAILVASGGVERARQELGSLGSSRIDAVRFAELLHGVPLDARARAQLARSAGVLRKCGEAPDGAFVVRVARGNTLHSEIASALSWWGRAFGATLAVDLMRTGQDVPAQYDRLNDGWPFDRWTRAHRLTAPPIVAVVAGSDLQVAALSEFLDGAQQIALVVEGECPPAPLVRHITPGTLVLQTSDETGLDRFAAYSGPAIAAFVPDGAACFLHDPEAGAASWRRLKVWRRPANRLRIIGGLSVGQQREELHQLEALAAPPSFPDTAIDALAPAGVGDATDRLANWLLAQCATGEQA